MVKFDESKHPRGGRGTSEGGRFVSAGGGSSSTRKTKSERKSSGSVVSQLEKLSGKKLDKYVKQDIQNDPDLDILTKTGKIWDKKGFVFKEGERSECHFNTSKLYDQGKIDAIVTGYALADGQWHQHTWGLKNDRIVETTFDGYTKYFGARMPERYIKSFIAAQYREHKKRHGK